MIVFYNKQTNEVFSIIEGRVHPEDVVEKAFVHPEGMAKENIGKFVVPYKPIYEEVLEETIQDVEVPGQKGLYRKQKVKQKVKRVKELAPDVPFADDIYAFESGKKKILKHKVKLDSNGNVVGFEEIKK